MSTRKSMFYNPKTLSLFSKLATVWAWFSLGGAVLYLVVQLLTMQSQLQQIYNVSSRSIGVDFTQPWWYANNITSDAVVRQLSSIMILTISTAGGFFLFKSISIGLNVLLEDEPPSDEMDNDEVADAIISEGNQPVFYKPRELLFFAHTSSIAAWVILAVYLSNAIRPFLFNFTRYITEPSALFIAIAGFFGQAASGVVNFAILKGVSYSLKVLMEFESNTHNVKN